MHIEIRHAEKLSFRERQVVVLKELGHSTEAIARQMGLTAGSVATLYGRARQKGYQVVIVLDGDPLRLNPTEEEDGGAEA